MEGVAAPILIFLCLLLFGWAMGAAGGIHAAMNSVAVVSKGTTPSLAMIVPALTGTAGFWASLVLNISDFSRYSKSQRGQLIGQAVGLPLAMATFGFVAILVTAATPIIFGKLVSDPVQVSSMIGGGKLATILSMVGVLIATLSTNIAANVVAPANALLAIFPKKLDFKTSGMITAAFGILLLPWKLVQSPSGTRTRPHSLCAHGSMLAAGNSAGMMRERARNCSELDNRENTVPPMSPHPIPLTRVDKIQGSFSRGSSATRRSSGQLRESCVRHRLPTLRCPACIVRFASHE